MTAQLAVEKECCCKRAPRPAEIDLRDAVCSREPAAVKDITVFMPFDGGGCRNIGILLAVNMTLLKPGCGRTEDKVSGTLDIALFIVLSALLVRSQKRVLVAQQPASAEHSPVAVNMYRHGLSEHLGIILEGDILRSETGSQYPYRICPEGAHIANVGMVIPGNDGILNALSLHEKIGHPRRDNHLFTIRSVFDEHEGGVRHICPDGVDSFLHRGEFTGAVCSHHDMPLLAEDKKRWKRKYNDDKKLLHDCSINKDLKL